MRLRLVAVSLFGLGLGVAAPQLPSVSAGRAPAAAAPAASWTAYLATPSGVVPIDTATNLAEPAIDVGGPATGVAITPNGRTAYVATDRGIVPLDAATRRPGLRIPVIASSLAITPDGSDVYATTPTGTVVRIPTATNRPGSPISIGGRAAAIAITPDGATAYVVADFDPGTVVPVDLVTRRPGAPITVGNVPRGVAVTPDGKTVWVTCTGQLWPIDTTTNLAGPPIAVGDLLFNVAISPTGTAAFVTDDEHQEVTRVDLGTGLHATAIPGGYLGVAITPDGRTAYATSDRGVLSIDVAGNAVTATIPVAAGAVAITPDQAPDADFTRTSARAGAVTRLDASPSMARSGRIVGYAWRFGDGTGVRTRQPVVGHVYPRAGRYTVLLTVTDSAGTSTHKVFTGQTMSRFGGPSAHKRHVVVIR